MVSLQCSQVASTRPIDKCNMKVKTLELSQIVA